MDKPSGTACATFVALALVSGAAAADEAKPRSGPTWTSGLGLVEITPKPEEAKAEDKPAAAAPSIPSSSVSAFALRAFAGVDGIAGRESLAPVLGASLRFEARHLRSLFSPWVDGAFSTTFPDKDLPVQTQLFDVALRGGLDVHPARISNIAVGPFIGYRQLHVVATPKTPDDAPSASSMLQGVDLGGQIHVRSNEAITDKGIDRPYFDGTVYTFVQTAGLANQSNRVFVGTLLSLGSDVRFFTSLEGCASESATCFPRQLRTTAGLGGMW